MPVNLPCPFPFIPEYIFTDIDDTLTLHGRLPVQTFSALKTLQEHGIKIVPVTGACSAWCDCIVRTWPVSTIVGENGALIMSSENGFIVEYLDDKKTIAENRKKLSVVVDKVRNEVPEAQLTRDTDYRMTDIAFDIGQDQILTKNKCLQIAEICQSYGANVRMSSIHINVWYGAHTKATTTDILLNRLTIPVERTIFVGDSPNDEDMFKMLDTTVGVVNITPFLDSLAFSPTYITTRPGGLGFAELTETILQRAALQVD